MKKLEDKKTKVNKELKRLKINKPRVFRMANVFALSLFESTSLQDRMKMDKNAILENIKTNH